MMKRIIVLGLLIIFGFFCEAKAQSLSTKILRIEIDGKETRKSYKVFFLSNGERIEAERTSTGFIIPSELKDEEYLTVLITFGKYRLEFARVHFSKFTEDWVIGIDKKPFSEENIEPEKAEMAKRVYYIVFEGSALETRLVIIEHRNK
jgi:hypothetical protein